MKVVEQDGEWLLELTEQDMKDLDWHIGDIIDWTVGDEYILATKKEYEYEEEPSTVPYDIFQTYKESLDYISNYKMGHWMA